jgi:hypothetical protein
MNSLLYLATEYLYILPDTYLRMGLASYVMHIETTLVDIAYWFSMIYTPINKVWVPIAPHLCPYLIFPIFLILAAPIYMQNALCYFKSNNSNNILIDIYNNSR